jgi:hypothetical protein
LLAVAVDPLGGEDLRRHSEPEGSPPGGRLPLNAGKSWLSHRRNNIRACHEKLEHTARGTYTNTADPTANYGARTLLDVDAATQTTYIQFNLSPIPAGYNNDVDGAQTVYSS